MASFKDFERALSSQLRNALNRTLTKISKEQKALLRAKLNVKSKYLHNRRLKPYRATQNDLIIKITATHKKITPIMLEDGYRPKTDYARPGKKPNQLGFYVRGVVRGVLNKGNTHGFNAVLNTKGKRPFYYLDGLKRLNDEALSLIDELKEKAQDIFIQELER
ncbi:hypothetical protein [Campylobacter mucosalis]|uniref:Uncharacterized protein n=1 Tax=Campylobacter mucosalis CCUG 21559 TaxID=1032067 RepID=A0A6G5QFL1_9BACT|nr:hypothetical protein [Campylobacter mucosalis]QCD44475.1 hypothetical protein CMUC_0676 [Campylobacter mucosalis CCUG 21559]